MVNADDSFQQARQASPGHDTTVPSPGEEEERQDFDEEEMMDQGDREISAPSTSPGRDEIAPSPGSDEPDEPEPMMPTDDDRATSAPSTSPGRDEIVPSPETGEPETAPVTGGVGDMGDVTAGDPVAGGEFAAEEDVGTIGNQGEAFTPEEARAEAQDVQSVTPSPSRTQQMQDRIASGEGPRVETTEFDIELTTPRERVAENIRERTGADVGPEDIETELTGPGGTPVDELTPQQQRSIAEAGATIRPRVTLTPEGRESIREARTQTAEPELGPRLSGSQGVSLGSGGRPTALVPEQERRERVSEAATTGGFLGPGNEEAVEGFAQGYSETFRDFFQSDPLVEGETQQPQDIFLEGTAQTAVEVFNVPGYISGAEDVANVATGAPTLNRFSGTTADLAKETAASAVGQTVEFATEEPLRASGTLAGIGVTAGASAAGASSTGVRGSAQAARRVARGDVELPSSRQLAQTAGRELAEELDPRVTPFGNFRGAASSLARRGRGLASDFRQAERGQASLIGGARGGSRTEIDTGDDGDLAGLSQGRRQRGRQRQRRQRPSREDPADEFMQFDQPTSVPASALELERSAVRSSFADVDTEVLATSFVPGFRAFEAGGLASVQRLEQAQTPSVETASAQQQFATQGAGLVERLTPITDIDVALRTRQELDQDLGQVPRTVTEQGQEQETQQVPRERIVETEVVESSLRDPDRVIEREDTPTSRDRDRQLELEDESVVEETIGGFGTEQERFEFESLFNPLGD